MQWSEILAEIKRALKQPSNNGHWDDTELLRRANIIQRRICRDSECIVKIDNTTVSIVDTREYDKLSNTLKIFHIRYGNDLLYPITIEYLDLNSQLDKIPYPWQDKRGTPTHYYETETKFGLYPTPNNADDIISIEYIKLASDLTSDTSVPFDNEYFLEDAHELIILGVLWKCFFEDADKRWQEAKNEFIIGINKLRRNKKTKRLMQTFDLVKRRENNFKTPLPILLDR